MTDTARALVLTEPRQLEARRLDLPEIRPDEALLRVEACGLCGTDHEQYAGLLPGPGPFVPGHEIVGVLERLGWAAAERWGVAEGDRVAVEVFQSCRTCVACRAGQYRRCVKHGLATMYGFQPVDRGSGLHGGYATHLHLGADSLVLPVPDGLDPVLATVFNPLGAGLRWTLDVGRAGEGDVVVVLGPGIRGLSCAVAAKEAGASFVLMTGLGERDADRLALAHRFGVDLTVDVAVDDPVTALEDAVGERAALVVDVTAKAPAALGQAVRLVDSGGRVVLAGTRASDETPGFRPDDIVYKEIELVGALGVDADAYRRALDLLASGRWPFELLPRRVVDLEGVGTLLAVLAGDVEGEVPVHAVLVP